MELLNSEWWLLDTAILHTLPFDEPAEFLRRLPRTTTPAVYDKVMVTRDGGTLLA